MDRKSVDFECCNHWAVIVKFDNRMIAYEIIVKKDDNGIERITPKWSHLQDSEKFANMIFLGEVQTSPADVRYKAAQNRKNRTTFNLISNNCQEWVQDLLSKMGAHLLRALIQNNIQPISQKMSKVIQSLLRVGSQNSLNYSKGLQSTWQSLSSSSCLDSSWSHSCSS